jgi:hypothetical protein
LSKFYRRVFLADAEKGVKPIGMKSKTHFFELNKQLVLLKNILFIKINLILRKSFRNIAPEQKKLHI